MSAASDKLIADVQAELNKLVNTNEQLKRMYLAIRNGVGYQGRPAGSQKTLYEFGEILSNRLSEILLKKITPELYADTELYQEVAGKILRPVLGSSYDRIVDAAKLVQEAQNKAIEVGLKPVVPEINVNRIDGLTDRLVAAENYDQVSQNLIEPIKNFNLATVDDFIRDNARFLNNVGIKVVVSRVPDANACSWCRNLGGVYDYEQVRTPGNDVWRRHEGCNCIIETKAVK